MLPAAPGFSRFELFTAWLPLAVVVLGLAAAGVVLLHADEVGPLGLVVTGGATGVLLLGLIVLLLGWL